jgi:hypothetical protein
MPNITVDSNVFCWLFDYRKENNEDRHVNALLGAMITQSYKLHIDSEGFIKQEYDDRVRPLILTKNACTNEVQLIRYFMETDHQEGIATSTHKELKKAVRQVIRGSQQAIDRYFVIVACVSGAPLISNNTKHINRHKVHLAKDAAARGYSLTIWTSREAQV